MPMLGKPQKCAPNRAVAKTDGYAPFLSTVPRAPEQKQQSKQKRSVGPGPGSYEVARPLVRPLIETLRKSNNNIIIKINEIGSPAFKDHSERFKELESNSPGPGQYHTIHDESEEMCNQRPSVHNSLHHYKSKFAQVFNQKKTETIPKLKILSSRQKKSLSEEKEIQERLKSVEHNKGSAWSKYAQQRFKQVLGDSKQPSPGPGSYDNTIYKHRAHPSSSFISESVRSFFDNIVYETNQDAKAQVRDRLNFKSNKPGPGCYELEQNRSSRLNKYQFFGSTEQRLIPEISDRQEKKEQRRRRGVALQRLASRMLQDQINRNAIIQYNNKQTSIRAPQYVKTVENALQAEPSQRLRITPGLRQTKPLLGSAELSLHASHSPDRTHMLFDKDNLF